MPSWTPKTSANSRVVTKNASTMAAPARVEMSTQTCIQPLPTERGARGGGDATPVNHTACPRPASQNLMSRERHNHFAPACWACAGLPANVEELPTKVFRRAFQTQLLNHLRTPARAELGTHARKLKPIPTTRKIVDEQLSVAHGLPQQD